MSEPVSTWSRAVVVGASSGIGEAVARALAASGTKVALVARRETVLDTIVESINSQSADRAHAFTCDAGDPASAAKCMDRIKEDFGPIDLLVYAAGVMPKGSATEFPTQEDLSAIQTNLAGAVIWINAAAAEFEARGTGTIVGISSVAGERGRRGNPVYNATKAGLSTYLESVRSRVSGKGVCVVTIKPGFVKTAMIGTRKVFPPAITPESAAGHIIDAARKRHRVAFVPGYWRFVSFAFRLAPAALLERLPV